MEITEVSDPDAFTRLRDEWRILVERCAPATVYQTWEWSEAWWRAFGKGKRLLILEARENGELIGLCPSYVSRHLSSPLRRLAFVGTGASDYLDILAIEEREGEAAEAFLKHLCTSSMFDIADLQQLRPSSVTSQSIGEGALAMNGSSVAKLIEQESCPFLRLPDTWDEFAKRLGKKMRSNIAYSERLLERTFTEVDIRLATEKELEEALSATFDLHQRRWKSRMLPGVMGGSRIQAFHRSVAQRFQENGWLRLHLLKLDGRIVATLYCFQFRKRYYYYLGGFDPELAKYSLGTILTAHAIRNAIEEGCEEFDFLRGAEPYKYRWQPEDRVNKRLLLYKPASVRSRSMVRLVDIERKVEHRLKVFAESRGRRKPS